MQSSRPTHQIIEIYKTQNEVKVETTKWIAVVKEDLKAAFISQTEIFR